MRESALFRINTLRGNGVGIDLPSFVNWYDLQPFESFRWCSPLGTHDIRIAHEVFRRKSSWNGSNTCIFRHDRKRQAGWSHRHGGNDNTIIICTRGYCENLNIPHYITWKSRLPHSQPFCTYYSYSCCCPVLLPAFYARCRICNENDW